MTGKTVLEHSDPKYFAHNISQTMLNTTDMSTVIEPNQISYSPMQVATTVTFTVALFQVNCI